ncbi:HQNO biosynthesis monooxygenase PqsL [Chitinivorax tropicus]|uniref:HQNO biosynthesis monooxygenase PqsL n=1 Tax=Chitinivorax tropicus TaxID=714531 RepID=A0A840MN52_9PROT|nr:FAD-dependent monooxygenase [Chitinivorax tropicus]MBB5017613.1 HQNO biosynthesis monooxygenase PqsL [Chitinivorax tropicus]
MKQDKIDVLINGCGIGGAVLAYALGRQGYRVAVVEQASRERNLNGADLLKPAGIQVLDDLGLLPATLAHGGRVRHEVEVFHDGELMATIDYRYINERGYFILIPCEHLRRMVLQQIESQLPNVRLLYQTRVTDVEYSEPDHISNVTLSDGQQLHPQVVVGCDGVSSMVRRWLGVQSNRQVYDEPMYFATFPLTTSVDQRNRLYIDSGRGLAYFYPVARDQTRLVICFPREEARTLLQDTSGEALRTRLRTFVSSASDDAIAMVTDTRDFKGIPIGSVNIDRYHGGNMVLLGDAIHTVHPITGQGMNLAIEDAGCLSSLLDQYFQGQITLPTALAAYQQERHPINGGVVEYGHRLASSFHDHRCFAANFNLHLQGSGRNPAMFNAA